MAQVENLQVSRYCRDYHTVPIPGVKAQEWTHFGLLESDFYDVPLVFVNKRVCKECLLRETLLSKVTKFQTTSVTNAKYHLEHDHDIVYSNGKTKLTSTEFHYSLVVKCCLDYSSFHSLKNIGFVNLIKLIRPDLTLPTGDFLIKHVLPRVYDLFKDHVKKFITENLQFGSVAFDIWIDNFYEKSYICFNLFFITKTIELAHVLLDVVEIVQPHTSFNILQKLRDVFASFEIDETKLTFVTDNAANEIAALRAADLERLSCSAHNVDLLTMRDCIPRNRK